MLLSFQYYRNKSGFSLVYYFILLQLSILSTLVYCSFPVFKKIIQSKSSIQGLSHIKSDLDVLNLPQYIDIFSDCLVNIINYNVINIDLSSFQVPVLLTRYDAYEIIFLIHDILIPQVVNLQFHAEISAKYNTTHGFNTLIKHHENFNNYSDFSLKLRWHCAVQVYLFPPTDYRDPNYERWSAPDGTEILGYLRVPRIYRNYMAHVAETRGLLPSLKHTSYWNTNEHYHKYTRPDYHILITTPSKEGRKAQRPWVLGMAGISLGVRYREHPNSHYLEFKLSETIEKRDYKITSISFHCKFCWSAQILPEYFLIEFPKNRAYLHKAITQPDTTMDHTPWEVFGDQFMEKTKIGDLHTYYIIPTHRSFRTGASVDVEHYITLDYMQQELGNVIFQNATYVIGGFEQFCNPYFNRKWHLYKFCHSNAYPVFTRRLVTSQVIKETLALNIQNVGHTFVSCGRQEIRGINFSGLISAFDVYTWISAIGISMLIFGFHFFWQGPGNHGIHKLFDLRNLWFDIIRLFMEQGSEVASADKLSFAFRTFGTVPWILAGLVLSNAYRGENITQLTAPLSVIPIGDFKTLVENNYTTYRTIRAENYVVRNEIDNYFDQLKFMLQNNSNMTQHETAFILDNTIPVNLDSQNKSFVSVLLACNDVALIMDRVLGESFVKRLERTLDKKRFKVSIGDENFYTYPLGWQISNWGNPQVPERISLVEGASGLLIRWLSLMKLSQDRKRLVVPHNSSYMIDSNVQPLTLSGSNTIALFVVYAVGAGICLIAFFKEWFDNESVFYFKRWCMQNIIKLKGMKIRFRGNSRDHA